MHPALPHAWIGSIYCKRSQIIKEKKRSQTSLQMEFRSDADRARSASGARGASVLRAPPHSHSPASTQATHLKHTSSSTYCEHSVVDTKSTFRVHWTTLCSTYFLLCALRCVALRGHALRCAAVRHACCELIRREEVRRGDLNSYHVCTKDLCVHNIIYHSLFLLF